MSTNQQNITESLKSIKNDNKTQKTNTKDFQEQSDKKIDALSQTVADAMAAILGMGAQFNTMSEQVFKISVQLDSTAKNTGKQSAVNEESGTNTQHNMNGSCDMDHDAIHDHDSIDKASDASLSSSASTKNSATSANSGISTYTHTSPVKKKRPRSKSRQKQRRAASVPNTESNVESNHNITMGRNLEASFQQHAELQAPTQVWQDTFEENVGEDEEEAASFSELFDDNAEETESEEDDTFNNGNHNEEEDEFMTPPSSPGDPNSHTPSDERLQHDINANAAPLNPQYNETTGSAGAKKN